MRERVGFGLLSSLFYWLARHSLRLSHFNWVALWFERVWN